MFTKQQVATFQRTLAAAAKWQAALEKLQEIAKHNPQFADRVADLKVRAENATLMAQTALAVEPVGK